jgi:hypothetical protein
MKSAAYTTLPDTRGMTLINSRIRMIRVVSPSVTIPEGNTIEWPVAGKSRNLMLKHDNRDMARVVTVDTELVTHGSEDVTLRLRRGHFETFRHRTIVDVFPVLLEPC